MELKVWVDGVQRVVCGVSEVTTCQEVVVALAQAIGKMLVGAEGGGDLMYFTAYCRPDKCTVSTQTPVQPAQLHDGKSA